MDPPSPIVSLDQYCESRPFYTDLDNFFHFETDPDHVFHFDTDQDHVFHFDMDPDLTL